MTNRFTLSAVALAMGSFLTAPVHGAVLTVNSTADNTTADDGLCTLREAIASVNSGEQNTDCSAAAPGVDDQIVFGSTITDASTIGLTTAQLEINNGVIITGPTGNSRLTIEQQSVSNTRVFAIDLTNADEGDTVSISDLRITGGSTTSGGGAGLVVFNSEVTINNCDIAGNNGFGYGGGVAAVNNSTVNIVDSTISGNSAYSGGGVYAVQSSTVNISESTVTYNSATYGGGIYLRNSSMTVSGYGSKIYYNEAQYSGGSVFVADGTATFTNRANIFSSNAGSNGGGIYLARSTVNLVNGAYLSGNDAAGFGGAIDAYQSTVLIQDALINNNTVTSYNGGGLSVRGNTSVVTIERSTVESNNAVNGFGGGVYVADGLVKVSNSSISGNDVGGKGGGIMANNGGSVTLTNATMVGNRATGDGGALNFYQAGDAATYGKIANSIISGNFSSGLGVEIMADGGPTIVNEGNNVLGESAETVAQAFYGFTPSNSDRVANSDGNLPTALEQIVGTRVIGLTQRYYPLVSGSPAIAHAEPSKCSDLDQLKNDRGFSFFVPIRAANGNLAVVDLGNNTCDAGAIIFD